MKPIKDFAKYYIHHYGEDLNNKIDPIDKMEYALRIFCLDCPYKCGGKDWETCSPRNEALMIMYPMYTSDGKIMRKL